MKKMPGLIAVWAAVILLITGCAGLQPQVALSEKESKKVVEMKAESFKFEPNNIKAYGGDTLIFRIENSSVMAHNFTITNPQQQILRSVDLPAGKMTEVRVTFAEPGIYVFYCDKPLHSSLGMKGRVEVVKKGPFPSN
jgi:plastocyanin